MSVRVARYLVASQAAIFLAACASSAKPAPPPPLATHTGTIERRTLTVYEALDGQVDPYLSANLAPQQSGTLTAIYANEGDRVRTGQTLAKIDDALLRADLTQQQGASVQSVAKLAQSKIQLPITTVASAASLEQARRTLEQARKTQIADAANVTNTKLAYEADRNLLREGFVAQTGYEQARATYVAAQQTLASDNDKIAQSEAALREARQNLANTPLQQQVIAQNRGAVEQSVGSVDQYRTAVAQTTIVAPFDGVVTARTLDPGSFASPNQAIFSVAQIDPIYVDFNVRDVDLAYVSPGTLVSFTTSAHPQRRYAGRVASIASVPAPGTLLYRARIVERNPDFALRGGLQVTVRVKKQVRRDALSVPRAAVIQNGQGGTIYTIDEHDGTAVAKETNVTLGVQSGGYVEISGRGIRPGMPIVIDQTDNLHDGSAIAVPSASPAVR